MSSATGQVTPLRGAADVIEVMTRIAEEVVAPAAEDVDARSRFPNEAIEALRSEGLLSALVPAAYGGRGASVGQVAQGVTALGRQCGSTAMVVAMHHIQVACLARHASNDLLQAFLREMVEHEYLLASATTELGTGGDVRRSICAVDVHGDRFTLEKQSPVISYGEYADAVLATARRSADSPDNDQVIVLCRRPELELEQVSEWNALGFRGTCSPGFVLRVHGDARCVFADPYGDLSAQTMLPVTHILWGAVWLGIASAAVERARRFVQSDARKHPGTTPTAASRFAAVTARYQEFVDLITSSTARFEELQDDPERLAGVGFTVAMNSLKVSASTMVVDVVRECMLICGLASYLLDSPYALGRHLRDAMGAALQVNNDRIMANNAQLLLVHRGE
jgi:acyl-CoA dehydrogenase